MNWEEVLDDIQDRKKKDNEELQKLVQDCVESFDRYNIIITSVRECERCLEINFEFTFSEVKQHEVTYWHLSEDIYNVAERIVDIVDSVKEIRDQYPEYCKQNDFIQKNRTFERYFNLKNDDSNLKSKFYVTLSNYLRLPNIKIDGRSSDDIFDEIQYTPNRVKEYNENIDTTINFLNECINELKNKKYNG